MRSIDDWLLIHAFGWQKFDRRANLKVRKKIIGNKKKAVFFFPYWTGKSNAYKPLIKYLGKDYLYVLYDYPKEILSHDAHVSIKYIKKILKDAKSTILGLRKQGVKEITLIGSSFGSDICVALANSVYVDKVVINMLDRNFASSIFDSPALTMLKRHYIKQGITLKHLDKIYRFISPEYNIGNLHKNNTKFLILISRNDIFCTYRELKPLIEELDRKKINYQLHTHLFLGHVLAMIKNLILPKKIANFIKS